MIWGVLRMAEGVRCWAPVMGLLGWVLKFLGFLTMECCFWVQGFHNGCDALRGYEITFVPLQV